MLVLLYQTTLLHIPEDSNNDDHFIRISNLTFFFNCIHIIISYLFSFRESVQDYKIHMVMEIVKFALEI